MWGDDPPFLTVGTEVSAKYKGAFCEAKVRKVVRSVKCKVTFKLGLGTLNVTDDQIRGGTLRVGSVCEVKHPEKKEFVEAVINKIQDCSQYTVVFDDGDITTLRRTALCLKSGRHFAESETLDQLPLTHPEHFSNPVIGGRKGRRSRQAQEDSSDEDDVPKKGKKKNEKEADIGKVVCVELGDKKKQKDNWFPGLVVAPTAQDTVRIRVKDEYLVRSFKDGRYFTVPKKEATEFTREIGSKVDNHTLKAAVEKALQYLDRDELPPHWDRDLLFGLDESSGNSDSDGALDSDSSDDEPREEKDHFVAQLYKFMDDRGTPINRGPTIGSKDVDLYKLFKVVHKLGGYNRVTNHNQWKTISQKLGFGQGSTSTTNLVKQSYKKFLHSFEDFYRKLGCTMVNHPRGHRSRHRTGRSLIRDRDRATPTIVAKEKEKKEEKPTPKVEETAVEKVPCEKEEENTPEDKKECPKVKETVKKSKVREEKSDNQSKSKGKDQVQPSAPEVEEKDNRPRNRKDNKPPVLRSEDPVKEEKSVLPAPTIKQEPEASDDSKSRETKLKTRDLKPKVKPNEKTKVKEEKPKVPEEEKVEEVKKKSEKKPETDEGEKVRPKPKEDVRPKKEGIPVQEVRPPKDLINRPGRLRKEDEAIPHLKKRGRKRKDMDEKPKPEEATGHLASHVTVCVGDKLKVYYGPTHESKVTYEAKVLEIEEDTGECLYLVHYTGWNTRYDEWIKRGRIADNLSWTPTRAKRQRQQQSQHKICRPSQGKRGRPSGLVRGNDGLPNPPRSTTPSSVTSSSSQNKSPASRLTPRSSRSFGDGQEFRRRTRRMSGHTDISVASDSESEDFQSDLESEVAQTRSRTTELRKSTPVAFGSQSHADSSSATPDSSPVATPPAVKEEPVTPTAIRKKTHNSDGGSSCGGGGGSGSSSSGDVAMSTNVSNSKPVIGESAVDETNNKTEPVFKGRVFSDFSEKRRSRRGKIATGSSLPHASNAKAQSESKLNVSNEGEESCEPKGRDFDLNQIRSELKGIEKTVKLSQDLTPSSFCGSAEESKEKGKIKSTLINWDITERASDVKIKPKKEIKEEEKHESKVQMKDLEEPAPAEEDVYEFKDTEPLELEVRKRDALSLSDCKSLPRRSGPSSRHFEPFSLANESTISSGSSHLSILGSSSVPNTSRLSSSKSPRKRVINASSKDSEMSNEGGKKLRATSKKKTPLGEGKSTSHLIKDVPKTETQTSNLSKPTKSSILSANHKMDDTCSSFLETVVSPLSVTQLSSTGLSRLQTSLTVGTVATSDNPSSPPLLSLPDVSEDDDVNIDGTNPEEKSHLGPLSLFSETHDDGDDDHEDRLVISESDDMATPLFSYQQRDHEDLFPTLVTSPAVVTSTAAGAIIKTEDPPCLSSAEGAPTIFQEFGSTILESTHQSSLQQSTQRAANRSSSHCVLSSPSDAQDGEDVIKDLLEHQHDYGDDSINAAICRALDRSIMDEDEDTSNEMELFCTKQIPGITSSADTVNSSLSFQNTPSSVKNISKGPSEQHKDMCVSFHDSDSAGDSSDEEDQRLVIDPNEDDGNSQTPSRSSPLSNNSLSLCIDNLQETQNQDSSCDLDTQMPSFENSKKETDITPTVIVSCPSSILQDSGKDNVGVSVHNAKEIDKSESLLKDADTRADDTTKVLQTEDRKKAIKFENDDKDLNSSSSKKPDGIGRSAITPVIVKMEHPMTTVENTKSSDVKTILKEKVPLNEATKGIMLTVGSKAIDSAKTVVPIKSSISVKDDFSKGIPLDTTVTTSATVNKSVKSTTSTSGSSSSSGTSVLSKYLPFCFSSSSNSTILTPEHDKSLKTSKAIDKDIFAGKSSPISSVSPAAIVIPSTRPSNTSIIGSRVSGDNLGIVSNTSLSSEKSLGELKLVKSVTCESTASVSMAAVATVSPIITVSSVAPVAPVISTSTVVPSLSTSTAPIIVSPSNLPFTLNVSSGSATIVKACNIAIPSTCASVSTVTSTSKTTTTIADSGVLVSAPSSISTISKSLVSSACNVVTTSALSSAAPISLSAAPVVVATYAIPPVSTSASLLMRVASPNSTTTAPGSATVSSVPTTVTSTICLVTNTTSSIVTTLTSVQALSASLSTTTSSTCSTTPSTSSSTSTSPPIISPPVIVSTVSSTIPVNNTSTTPSTFARSSISITCSSITSSSDISSTATTAPSISAASTPMTSSNVSSKATTTSSTAVSTVSVTAAPFTTQTLIPVAVEKVTNPVGATSTNSSSVGEGTSPVTILVGSSPALGTTNTAHYKYIISSCNSDDSTSSGSGIAVDAVADVNLISESLATSSSTPPVCSVVSSISTCTSAVTATVTSTSSTPSSAQSTIVPSTSTASQPNSNLKIVCDAIKHSDSASVIALTSLPLGETDILSGDIRLDSRSDDADSQLLGSLLCQETIPGSPAQITDGGFEESVQESKVLVLEMPFASVPASNCDDPNSSVPLSVPMSVPLSLPMVNVSTLSDSKSIEKSIDKVDTIEPSVVDAPGAAVPSGPEVVTSQVSAASSSHHVLVIPSASEAAPVMENTPPTTPDSSLSTISGSPREDHRAMSPGLDNESSKSHRDSFEMDLDSCPEDSPLNVEVTNSCKNRLQALELITKKELELDKDGESSPKKRRRSRKRSESENKKLRCSSNKSVRPSGGTGSDSDDTSENSALDCTPLPSSESTLSSKSPRPSKYNFYVELDPELDGSQRIALLQQKLQELRKTYMNVKAELACIDRRRKKLRRREREVEKTKQEVTCS